MRRQLRRAIRDDEIRRRLRKDRIKRDTMIIVIMRVHCATRVMGSARRKIARENG